ncbi:MAG: NUDIX domain-containing protein [Acetobacteraceae bacterium]
MPPRTPAPIPSHPAVEILEEKRVWSGRFPLDVIRFRHRRFDGSPSQPHSWELWRRGRAAALVPYDPAADAVVLIEQFRFPALAAGLDPVLVELPAGLCEDGETPEATIRREMREEMGLDADRVEWAGHYILSAGGTDETCDIFMGRVQAPPAGPDGIAGTGGVATENEDIRVRVWPAATAIDHALTGRFPNAITTIGLLWLAARRDWLRQHWKTP